MRLVRFSDGGLDWNTPAPTALRAACNQRFGPDDDLTPDDPPNLSLPMPVWLDWNDAEQRIA